MSLVKDNCVKVFRFDAVSGSRALPNGAPCLAENILTQTDIVRFIPITLVPKENFLKFLLLLWQMFEINTSLVVRF